MSLYLLQNSVNSNQLKFLTTGKLTMENKALPCNNSCKSPNLWPNEIHCPAQKVVSVWRMTDDGYWCAVCRVSGWPPRSINHVWVSVLVSCHLNPPRAETDRPLQSAWQVPWSEVKVSAGGGWWRCGEVDMTLPRCDGTLAPVSPHRYLPTCARHRPVELCRPHKPVLSRCTLGQQAAARRRPGPWLVLPPVDFYLPPVTEQDQRSLGREFLQWSW